MLNIILKCTFKIKPRAPSLLLPFGVEKNQEIEVELVELPPCDQLIRYLWTGVPNPVSGHVSKMGWWHRKKSKKVYLQTSTLHSYLKKKIILLLSLLSQTSGWRWGGGRVPPKVYLRRVSRRPTLTWHVANPWLDWLAAGPNNSSSHCQIWLQPL